MPNLAYPTETEERLLALDEPHRAGEPEPKASTRSNKSVSSYYEVEDKVKRAEEQLVALQQKRERLEQQKEELELLSAKQQQFTDGKSEVVKVLTDALPTLEAEASDAHRKSEFLNHMSEVFRQHLAVLATLDAENWEEKHLKVELERGMAALNEAKNEIERFDQRLATFGDEQQTILGLGNLRLARTESEFAHWMKIGFAFALPLMIFTAMTLLIVYIVATQ